MVDDLVVLDVMAKTYEDSHVASLLLSRTGQEFDHKPHSIDGMTFANAAIEFAALAWEAEKVGILTSRLHLYALAIELACKSLALRLGATPDQCKKACHKIEKMISLIESLGGIVSEDIKRRVNEERIFQGLVGTRYPIWRESTGIDDCVLIPSDLVGLVAAILDTPCASPLTFRGGGALAEIQTLLERKRIDMEGAKPKYRMGPRGAVLLEDLNNPAANVRPRRRRGSTQCET